MESEHDGTINLWGQVERDLGVDDRFRILGRIGAGGMGEVYRARQIGVERDVAIKILSSEVLATPEATARFLREAQVLSTLEHPNIVRFFQYGIAKERPYHVVDLLEGITLETRLASGPLSVSEFQQVFSQIIDALKYASSMGLVHRDIKPANIFLCNEEGKIRAVLLDFGIVRQLQGQFATLTASQAILGSPAYMSPEQCRGTAVDVRSDIYSLACTMYEALSGRRLFEATNMVDLMMRQMTAEPPKLRAYHSNGAEYKPDFVEMIDRCLAKDPAIRPASFEILAAEYSTTLESLATGTTFVVPAVRPKRTPFIITAVATLLLITGASYVLTVSRNKIKSGDVVGESQLLAEIANKSAELRSMSEEVRRLMKVKKSVGGSSIFRKRDQKVFSILGSYNCLYEVYSIAKNFPKAEEACRAGLYISDQAAESADRYKYQALFHKNLSQLFAQQAATAGKEHDGMAKQAITNARSALNEAEHIDRISYLKYGIHYCAILARFRELEEADKIMDKIASEARVSNIAGVFNLSHQFGRETINSILLETRSGPPLTLEQNKQVGRLLVRVCETLVENEAADPEELCFQESSKWLDNIPSDDPQVRELKNRLNKAKAEAAALQKRTN